jgi:diaminohydroxyphosphoribosylaminopyrimidine deaminase/5-amino-6-(5-phosphoribosylamino)uracil reductase
MELAIQLARAGQGHVEPNPMVGCVIVRDDREIGRGFHRKFGDKHAEVEALESCSESPGGATAYVTLEPCCHQGKTPPCAHRLIEAGVARVVVAHDDPFPAVAGRGIEQLRQAGIQVDVGLMQQEARGLNAPYLKSVHKARPWVMAKWAMTLDGKIATRTGDSQWISSEASRAVVHEIRGRVDAIVIGSQTAIADDPLLTARPRGPRVATRVVVDSELRIPVNAQLVRSADQFPTLLVAGPGHDPDRALRLQQAGCEIIRLQEPDHNRRLLRLLDELGNRQMTNVLVEGGAGLLGGIFDIGEVDEVHVFIGNRIVGGRQALTAIRGIGIESINRALALTDRTARLLGDDVYISGRILKSQDATEPPHPFSLPRFPKAD